MKNSRPINHHILRYMEMVEKGEVSACKEQHDLVAMVRYCFTHEDIYVNEEQLENYIRLVNYFPYHGLYEWEEFCMALHLCTYRADGLPRWPDLFLLVGRGAGKDGYIGVVSFCLISPYNGIKHYDVDICATNEEQAMTPFLDVLNALESPAHIKKLRKFFYWNKEEIISTRTGAKLKYRTNNAKGKDGLRSGIVVFNEEHQYQDYANINVFTTGLGKKPHPRRLYATTNGDVRDGPLDHHLEKAHAILGGYKHGKNHVKDNGFLPFICKLDSRDEVHNEAMWEKANPSLRHKPELLEEVRKEYVDWKAAPSQFTAFMTKRMNIPDGNPDIEVTSWDNIKATNKPVIDLTGRSCVGGVDFVLITDMASAGLKFLVDGTYYWVSHSWICKKSKDIPRIKFPLEEAQRLGLLTIVDDVEVPPELIVDWYARQAEFYTIKQIAMDRFRYALLKREFLKIGFDAKEAKNIKLVTPSDIIQVVPSIDHQFATQQIAWGDNMLMRWAVNNTKKVKVLGVAKQDKGNYTYGKIEPKSRKTDPFMAYVAASTLDHELDDVQGSAFDDLPVITG